MLEKRIFYQQMNRIELTIILALLGILIIPGTSIASPNDACFVCHTSHENRSIDQSLYNSNPHSILECIDCHENSTNPPGLDPDHGKFIRQLNGSNITGPLLTKYYSENFSLCYYCHSEQKLIGVLSSWPNPTGHQNPPNVVTSIETNFINTLFIGRIFSNWPANIHWDHLDDFGSIYYNGGAKFDSNHDRLAEGESYQSCPACHDVHGTNYPKLTRNGLVISYGYDVTYGDYGMIGSDNYLDNTSIDFICSGACHTGQRKYYRPEKKLFEDCISCHATTMTKDFNITAFGQGVHVDINSTNGIGDVNNSDCWTCHYRKDMNKSKIYTCVNCHVPPVDPGAPSAPQITSHKPGKTNKSSCEACHELVKLDPGLNSAGQNYPDVTAHYAELPSVPTPNYCDYCHGPQASSLFQTPYRNITSFYHNSSNASFPEDSNCRTCHTRTDVTADPLANNNSNFHNMTTEYGDVKNYTKIANCIDCHVNHDANFTNAPSPTHSTSGMNVDYCYQCHGTKVTGSNATKLHDVRSFVTSGCVQCHVDRNDVNTSMFGLHEDLNKTGGLGIVTDEDCNTCHFGGRTGVLPMIPDGATHDNTYYCENCHTKAAINENKSTLIIDATRTFKHGSNNCISCHAPDMYHVKGTAGPRGRVENPGWGPEDLGFGLISRIDYAGCHDCHRTHNGLDEPFHGPGIGSPGSRHIATNSFNNGSDCSSSCHTSSTNPHNVKLATNNLEPTLSIPVLSPSTIIVNNPVDVTSTGSALSTITSLQIEAAQYNVNNSIGQTLINWTSMNATDGRFNSSLETVNATINTTGLPEGTYNVSVRVMASGPRTNISERYYPLNGDWSIPQESTLIIEQPKGFINGTVRNGSDVIQYVTVSTAGFFALTDSTGFYSLRLSNGTYALTATKDPDYYPRSISGVPVTAPDETSVDINMDKKPNGTISGIVTNNSLG